MGVHGVRGRAGPGHLAQKSARSFHNFGKLPPFASERMLLVPTYCQACSLTALTPAPSDGEARCGRCREPSEVLPGELYRAADEALFQRLADIVRGAQLSLRTASLISTELSNRCGRVRGGELALQRVVDFQPSLYAVEPLLLADVAQLPKALGMLRVIVSIELRAAQARSA